MLQTTYMKQIIKNCISFCLFLSVCYTSLSQEFNGKNLKWRLPDNTDKRFTALFGTPGRSFGTEECVVSVTSRYTKTLYIEFKLTLTDLCGNKKEQIIKRTVGPGKNVGGTPWFDGFNYDPACEAKKKYGDNFYTKVQSVSLEVLSVKEKEDPNKTITGNTDNSKEETKEDPNKEQNNNSSNTNNNNNNNNTSTYTNCTPVNFSVTNGITCFTATWFCSVGYNTMVGNEFKQVRESQNFIFQWRLSSSSSWNELRTIACPMGEVTIKDLDPCTRYEARLLRDCGNGKTVSSNIAFFTTGCQAPQKLSVKSFGRNSATLSYFRSSTILCESFNTVQVTTVVEYKSPNSIWETLYCNPGEGCTLNALSPGTTYRVRARNQYRNGKFSAYTSEVAFTTTK